MSHGKSTTAFPHSDAVKCDVNSRYLRAAEQFTGTHAFWFPSIVRLNQHEWDALPAEYFERQPQLPAGRRRRSIQPKNHMLWSLLFIGRQTIPYDCQLVGEPGDVWLTETTVQVRTISGWTDWVKKCTRHGGLSHPYLPTCKLGYRPQTMCLAYGQAHGGVENWRKEWARLTPSTLCQRYHSALGRADAQSATRQIRKLLTIPGGTRLVPFMDITEAGLAALLYPFFSSDIPLAAEAVSETNIQPVVAPSTYGGTEAGDQHEQPEWPETLSLSFQHSSPKKQMAVAPRLDEPLSPDSQNSQPSSVHSPQTPESPLTPPPWTPYSAPAPLLQIPGPTLAHQQAPQQVPMVVDSPDIGGALPALPQDVSQPFALVHHLFGVIGSLESRVAVLEGQVSGVRPRGHTVSGISMVPPSQPEGSLPESVSYAGYAASPSMLTREHSYVVPLSMASPMLVPFPSSSSYSSASPIAIPETDAQGAQGSRKPSIAVSAPMEPSGERSAGAPVTIQNQATTHPDTGSSLWSRVTRWWQAQP